MMDRLSLLLFDASFAALAVNLGIPAVLILGVAWLAVKAAASRPAVFRRGILLAALLSAVLAPAAGLALHRCGLAWTFAVCLLAAGRRRR